MSKYANKWQKITVEEYRSIYNDKLKPYSSYTNPDGNDGLSSQPQMLTTWGDDEKEIIKSIARREKTYPSEQHEVPWEYSYYKAIDWEEEE